MCFAASPSSDSIPVLRKFNNLILTTIVNAKASLHVTVLDETKLTPLAEAQEGARGVDGEAAAHVGQEESTLTEDAFDVN
jgi:hypothetical protein